MQNEINELRNQIRTLKRVLYTLCSVGVLGGLLAATNLNSVPDVIQAKKFEVVNDEGKIQAMLFADPGGGALGISNKDGKPVAAVRVDADGDGAVVTQNGKGQMTSHTP